MSAPKSYVVGEHFQRFIEQQITSGRFSSVTDVVEAGLRLLEDEDSRLAELRRLIAEGDAELDAGLGLSFDSPEHFLAEIARRAGEN